VVRLAHRRLKPEAVALRRASWHHYLPTLALAASGRIPAAIPGETSPLSAAAVLPA